MTSNNTTADLDLDAIEARVAAATPGPWCTVGAEIFQGVEYMPDASPWIGETCRASGGMGKADAVFAAHARTDVPALLAEVRRLRAELGEYEVLNPQRCPAGKHADWLVDSEYAHACPWCEIERLRARVTELKRPAVEAERNEIRQSFTEIAAQAEQDYDYEAAANFRCRLREREEQWAREDAVSRPSV
jgi:hypothetical protein